MLTPKQMDALPEWAQAYALCLDGDATTQRLLAALADALIREHDLRCEIEMLNDPCICYGSEARGYSVCGVVCPEHYMLVVRDLQAKLDRAVDAIRDAADSLAHNCTCMPAYRDRGMTAPDCIGCWVADGMTYLTAALRDLRGEPKEEDDAADK